MGFLEQKIDKSTPIPLYFQLKQIILGMIENGELKPGDSIPTEYELISMYSLSRTTVRQAIIELVQDGLLYRVKGKGTFISKPKLAQDFMQRLESFGEQMNRLHVTPSTKVKNLKVLNGSAVHKTILEGLNLNEDDQVIYLERLRFANDQPIVLVRTYLPMICLNILTMNLEDVGLYETLSNSANTKIVEVERQVEAILSEPYESDLLEIPKHSAVQLTTTVGFNAYHSPIEYSVAHYRGDKNKFTVKLRVGE